MADFLQHLVDPESQRQFLTHALGALAPGGWFLLSFFNINIKNRLRNDIRGAFAGGNTPYRRMTANEVIAMLPGDIKVTDAIPMNIFHSVLPDRSVARLPFARLLARMICLYGRKVS